MDEAQPKGSFAAHIRGGTKSALPLSFPIGLLESLPRMSDSERAQLQQTMRERYAVHYSELDRSLEPHGRKAPDTNANPEPRRSPPGQIDTDAGETW